MYELIEHRKLDANAASIMFSNIPNTYTDLALFCSTRANYGTESYFKVEPNETSANTNMRVLYGDGAAAYPFNYTNRALITFSSGSASTSNTFGNTLFYIANYASSVGKSVSMNSVGENNATTAYQIIGAGLWNNTAVIDRLNIVSLDANGNNGGNFVANSSFTLYGVNRRAGIGRAPLAMGGYMSYSNGYWVHTFPASGSFIPFTNMDVEYLVVAGGGGGSLGGGGAGGYRSSVIGELSGANSSAESTLSLTANTNYTVTVGAGGTGSSSQATNGSNSVFSTITATGGGGGAALAAAGNGGSGGGAADFGRGGRIGTGTSGQGNNGGQGTTDGSTWTSGGGGGGASQIGATTTTSAGGKGGDGLLSSITGSPTFRAGGGGGGAQQTGAASGAGGIGGGGSGGSNAGAGSAGTANTGGGAGGGTGNGVSGGSGIVIVRYKA